MTHVRTSPFYPQSNGKIERWHKSLKSNCIRPGTPLSLDDARRLVEGYVEHYNNVRLNSAIGYITPKNMLAGRQKEIHAERDRKPESARQQRQIRAGNLWRRLLLPQRIGNWSLTSLQQRLVKTGGRLIQARPLLPATAGRESSNAAALWEYGAAYRCAAGAGGL